MAITHNLGLPHIGLNHQARLRSDGAALINAENPYHQVRQLRDDNILLQASSGLDWVPCGDFSLYDRALDTTLLLGNAPERFRNTETSGELDVYFRMACGSSPDGAPVFACETAKWFDTNYRYVVPEFGDSTSFSLNADGLLDEIQNAQNLAGAGGCQIKPVILGPLTYLWLGKSSIAGFDRLRLLDAIIPLYCHLLARLQQAGVEWVQIDEPILVLDLPTKWQDRFEQTYHKLQTPGLKLLLATYFGTLGSNLTLTARLPVAGIHLDAVCGRTDVPRLLDVLPVHKVLSLGVIDGRNRRKTNLTETLKWLEPIYANLGDHLWLAPSCSLLHVQEDTATEMDPDLDLQSWRTFARQKLSELNTLKIALNEERAAMRPRRISIKSAEQRAESPVG